MLDLYFQVGGRQMFSGLLWPLDQNDGFVFENVPKPGIQPFTRIAKSIKIKVIEV